MLILRSEICQTDGERRFLLSRNSFIGQPPLKQGWGAALQLCQIPATNIHLHINVHFQNCQMKITELELINQIYHQGMSDLHPNVNNLFNAFL